MDAPQDVGIRHLYPRIPVSAKLRAYIALTRPFTLTAVLVGIIVALAMAVHYTGLTWTGVVENWRIVVHGAATLLLVQIGSNAVNQSHDYKEDAVNRPYRPIPQDLVTPSEARTLGHVAWFVAILRASSLDPDFGVLVMALIVTSYAYSSPPLRLKARLGFGNAAIATARGLLGLVAAWTILAPVNHPAPWVAGGILAVFLAGATTAKDYADADGDAAMNINTLPAKLGPTRATWASLPFILSPIVTLPLAHQAGVLTVPWPVLFPALLAVGVFAFTLLHHYKDENRYLEGTRPWAWMYYAFIALFLVLGSPGLAALLV